MTPPSTATTGTLITPLDGDTLRRVVAVLCFTEIVSWGVLFYAFPVLAATIATGEGWPLPNLMAAFTLAQLVAAAAGVWVGHHIDGHGPHTVMTAGSTLSVLHAPASGASAGALNVLAQMEQVGLRPPMASTAHQYVITDKAYVNYVGYNEWLLANRYSMVTEYAVSDGVKRGHHLPHRDMSPPPSSGQPATSGPYLFNGVFLCPGIGVETLRNHAGLEIPHEDQWTPRWIRAYNATERQFVAAKMPTNGRPKQVKAIGRGRPRRDAPPVEKTWSVEVTCPAQVANPKVRCPRVPDTLALDPNDYPTLKYAPERGAPAPRCCGKDGFMRLTLGSEAIKTVQPKMAGTWDHKDLYAPARTRTEAYFGRLADPDGGDLTMGRVEWTKNAPVALAVTAVIVATNLRVLAKWEEDLATDGRPPAEVGARRRAYRAYLAKA